MQKMKKFRGRGETNLNITESTKISELKYRQITTSLSLFLSVGMTIAAFFPHKKLLYLLNPGILSAHIASTAGTTAELQTPVVVVKWVSWGAAKKGDLQGATMASGLQTSLK